MFIAEIFSSALAIILKWFISTEKGGSGHWRYKNRLQELKHSDQGVGAEERRAHGMEEQCHQTSNHSGKTLAKLLGKGFKKKTKLLLFFKYLYWKMYSLKRIDLNVEGFAGGSSLAFLLKMFISFYFFLTLKNNNNKKTML